MWKWNNPLVIGKKRSSSGEDMNFLNWTSGSFGGFKSYYSIAYGNNIYVAVGGFSSNQTGIITSPDGINWTERQPPFGGNVNWTDVIFADGKFVAVTDTDNSGQAVMTSTNGTTWTLQSAPSTGRWKSITYANSLYVVVGLGEIMTSSNATTWTKYTAPGGMSLYDVVYGNGRFVAVGNSPSDPIATSTNGTSWTRPTGVPSGYFMSVAYGNGRFVAAGGNDIMTSTDGITWTKHPPFMENLDIYSVDFGNGLFVAIYGDVDPSPIYTKTSYAVSVDGVTWWTNKNPFPYFFTNVRYINNRFFAVDSGWSFANWPTG